MGLNGNDVDDVDAVAVSAGNGPEKFVTHKVERMFNSISQTLDVGLGDIRGSSITA